MEAIRKVMLIRPGVRYPRQAFGQPRGLMCLASALREATSGPMEISLVRQALKSLDAKQVGERIRSFDPDLVGFSCMTMEAKEMHRLAGLVKKFNPRIHTVVGGPHGSMFYEHALQDPNLDLAVINEGEITFVDLVKAFDQGRPLEEVPGLAFRRGDRVETTVPRELIPDLDKMPLPAWDLVNLDDYCCETTMNGNYFYPRWAMVMTSRGCPHRCVYCHNLFGKRTRFRGVEKVMAEIDLLVQQFGMRELHVIDDLFNADLPRAKRICDEIIARDYGLKIAFPNALRADRMDRELLEKLKEAGCYSITYGLETASPRMQKFIAKNLDMEKAKTVIAMTRDAGIVPQGFFMVGFPGETPAEIEATVQYAIDSKLLRAWFFSVILYPRSKLLELAKQIYPDFDFDRWDMTLQRPWAENNFLNAATGIDMFRVVRDANRRFYLRFAVIFSLLWMLPKNESLLWGIWWGIKSVFPKLHQAEAKLRDWAYSLEPLAKRFHYHARHPFPIRRRSFFAGGISAPPLTKGNQVISSKALAPPQRSIV